MRADRLLALVLLLRARRRATAAELAAELDVSVRTVLRDLDALGTAGVPVYAERGRGGGFSLLEGWTTDLSGLTLDEARSLLIAGSQASRALGTHSQFATALAKVLSSVPDADRVAAHEQAGRILVLDESYVGAREDVPALSVLHRALVDAVHVRFAYVRRDGTASERAVDPAGLVCADGVWYLLGLDAGRERVFRVSRMSAARATTDAASRAARAADLDAWWQRSRSSFRANLRAVPAVVHGSADALERLGRRVEVVAAPEGHIAHFPAVEAAVAVLWAEAGEITVTAPDELVDRIVARARGVLARHAAPS